MKYISTPCKKCDSATVRKPEKRSTKWMAFCDKCGKWNGVKRWKVGDEWHFTLYPIGRPSSGMVHTHRIEEAWSAELSMDEFRRLLRIGKEVLDKRLAF